MAKNKIVVSHFQYADNTMFTCLGSWEIIRAIKDILRNFEVISGLKINFNKCCILSLNMEQSIINQMADFLNCEVG